MNDLPNSSTRASVIEIDNLLGKSFKVLDDGFVRVIDYMGNDSSIVQAARVSYGEGTKKLNEDRGLIRYLMQHDHTTPFEMCEIKLHVRVPMDCWRQWIRHRTANVNEYSTRYSLAIDSVQKTEPNKWRMQSPANKQGSSGFTDLLIGEQLSKEEGSLHNTIKEIYQKRIELGVAREQARKDLPLSTYTEAYWKIDLHNLFHFLRLRIDSHSQFEIRSYAIVIGQEIVKKWCPIAWEAFEDYKINAISFSKNELLMFVAIQSDINKNSLKDRLIELGFVSGKDLRSTRELIEFENKLSKYNIDIPWK